MPRPAQRKIIHIDCDCFYAAVEIRDDPSLRGRPVAVGGDPGRRGVIATCNYEARRFGVRSAIPSSQALRLCPELVILKPDFDRYRHVSGQIQEIFRQYTNIIEPLSLDEAFLDVSTSELFENSATRIAIAIRQQVAEQVGITVSAGVAPNKFLAKIASDWNKPDGLCVIRPEQVEAFVRQLPVEKIFGVGRVTAQKLHNLGVTTCEQLHELSRLDLASHFGSFGERLWQLSRGIDDRPVHSSRRRKSVSVERTFSENRLSAPQWQAALPELMESLQQRMQRLDSHYLIHGLLIKVRYSDFTSATRETAATLLDEGVFRKLLTEQWEKRGDPVRLIGIGVRLKDTAAPRQGDLFGEEKLHALALQRTHQT
ncbi:MAG: DNA polymerase IV [Gammaproteobacteria bacterium HGW-Gammaproteobacteria-14]|nr:MAG: DNA polymerase IV [Gammaproteobacteria bacterium HGW-Gammaproteobacteria-14]